MTPNEARERIQTLLNRTEERGASEAEANSAARLVCKLLRTFPELLSSPLRSQARYEFNWPEPPPQPERTKDDSQKRAFCFRMVRDTAGLYQVYIKSRAKTVWLPHEHCTISGDIIWIPIWLCKMKDLD